MGQRPPPFSRAGIACRLCQGDVECSYPESSNDTEILGLTRTDLSIPDEARTEIAGGFNHAS